MNRDFIRIYFNESNTLTKPIQISHEIIKQDDNINVFFVDSDKLDEIKELLVKPGQQLRKLFVGEKDVLNGIFNVVDVRIEKGIIEFNLVENK